MHTTVCRSVRLSKPVSRRVARDLRLISKNDRITSRIDARVRSPRRHRGSRIRDFARGGREARSTYDVNKGETAAGAGIAVSSLQSSLPIVHFHRPSRRGRRIQGVAGNSNPP